MFRDVIFLGLFPFQRDTLLLFSILCTTLLLGMILAYYSKTYAKDTSWTNIVLTFFKQIVSDCLDIT
jgi:hypothetical protein